MITFALARRFCAQNLLYIVLLNEGGSVGFSGTPIMGIVWETSHKGVPLLGVPENTLEWVLGE